MLDVLMFLAGCSLATLLIVLALQWVYDQGVEDTEQRWREAVAKAQSEEVRRARP